MQRIMMKSKLHRATVTDAQLQYEGSVTIDEDLMDAADILLHEQVDIYNVNNGERFTTYVIKGKRGSGEICLNGAAARKVQKGDLVIIVTYAMVDDAEATDWPVKSFLLDDDNRIARTAQ